MLEEVGRGEGEGMGEVGKSPRPQEGAEVSGGLCAAVLTALPQERPFRTSSASSVNEMLVQVGLIQGLSPPLGGHTSQPGALLLSLCLGYDSLSEMSLWPVCSPSALLHEDQGFVLPTAAFLVSDTEYVLQCRQAHTLTTPPPANHLAESASTSSHLNSIPFCSSQGEVTSCKARAVARYPHHQQYGTAKPVASISLLH